MNRHSLVFKLTLFLSLFFVSVMLFIAFANVQITRTNLKQSEEDKIRIIVNTVLPIISMNMSFGFDEPVKELIESLPKGNRNILAAQILAPNERILYSAYTDQDYTDIFVKVGNGHFFHQSDIIDPVTGEMLGTLRLAYSNTYYQRITGEYEKFLIYTIIPILAIFALFVYVFYKKLSPIRQLSQKLATYSPSNESGIRVEMMRGKDEIAVINNTAKTMLENIQSYTNRLSELNQNLEAKIRKEVEKNREKDRILIQQSRQAALGEMIGNIAHQWRQPINALGLILQDIEDAHEHQELSTQYLALSVDQAMELISHMSDTIDDFRNFFLPNKEKDLFTLDQVINNTLKIVGASLESEEIHVEVQIRDAISIYSYQNEFTQVFINMINNSKDAFKNSHRHDKRIRIESYYDTPHNELIILVSDNAGGIPEAIMDKIFDPYFTTKYKDKGTGIGLYMAKAIIETNMGGVLKASNTDGGAKMLIQLPMEAIRKPGR